MRGPRDEGSADAVALAVLTPALLLLLGLIIVAGRLEQTSSTVESAARAAARSASLDPHGSDVTTRATAEARSNLDDEGLHCTQLTVTPTIVTAGATPYVRVKVACVVDLSDVAFPGLPGSTTRTATFTSPIDVYRSSS